MENMIPYRAPIRQIARILTAMALALALAGLQAQAQAQDWVRVCHQGSTAMKTIVIGVMPQEQIRARALAIVKGEYKPKSREPKIWLTSMKSVAEVLSDQNRDLLKVIRETNPDSMTVLAKATGWQPGNLSRTLKTMARYGLVALQREKSHVRPVLTANEFGILAAA